MKITSSRRFRYWVINSISSDPSPVKAFILQGLILLTLLFLTVPIRATREIAYGRAEKRHHPKISLRSMIWLWNRSWVPVKYPLATFFDIGWLLSEESCRVLRHRGFLSKNPLKQKCDLAQYTLSAIREGTLRGDSAKLEQADREIVSLVSSVFNEAWGWASSTPNPEPQETAKSPEKAGKTQGSEGWFDIDSAKTALFDFDDLCRQLGQEYFLVSGTFLGAVREGTFIGHDYDIDLGIFEDALLDTMVPALERSRIFSVSGVEHVCLRRVQGSRIQYEMMEKPVIIKLFHHSGIAIDLFVHFYERNLAWHGSSTHRWDNQRFELTDYPFLGRSFKGAKDFERYLSENYGADWRVPKSDYDPLLDTPNMSYLGSANALVFYAWMLARAVAEQQPQRVIKCIQMLEGLGVIDVHEQGITIR